MSRPELKSYDRFVVAFSGGKDSIASLLTLLDAGISPDRIDCYHHDVDGDGAAFMGWPCTTAYCRAVTDALGVPLYLSWREGGFLREMLRDDVPTAPIRFQTLDGLVRQVGGTGQPGTRCMSALIRAQDRFLGRRTLILTGERAEESTARAHYATFEPDRTDTRNGTRKQRHVDHWRPVHGLTESQIWEMLRRYGIVPAPAYRLGWSRLSCIACIFGGNDQWATIRHIAPERFEQIASYEDRFDRTIHRTLTVRARADRGRPYLAAVEQPALAAAAMRPAWTERVRVPECAWQLPAGAFGNSSGPG